MLLLFKPLSMESRVKVLLEMKSLLSDLYESNIFAKMDSFNIFLDSNNAPKIAGFGLKLRSEKAKKMNNKYFIFELHGVLTIASRGDSLFDDSDDDNDDGDDTMITIQLSAGLLAYAFRINKLKQWSFVANNLSLLVENARTLLKGVV